MTKIAIIVFAAIALAVSRPAIAASETIAIALTDDAIKIDAGFSGATLTLFGAVSGVEAEAEDVDIIAVVEGPAGDYNIRVKEQHGLIWLPGAPYRIENAPRFFSISATDSIDQIAPLPDQAQYTLGINRIDAIDLSADEAAAHPYNAAFLETQEYSGQYRESIGGVEFVKGALFTMKTELPASTPVGAYKITVFLYRNGSLLDQDEAAITVNKVGLERQIYDLAHERPFLYGLLCVAVSLLAGWIAGVVFRKS